MQSKERKTTILLIEDDKNITNMITDFLNVHLIDVVSANDGLLGIQKAGRQQFDAIILDVNLPKLSGEKVVREIRKLKIHTKTPILMLSGFLSTEVITQVRDQINKALVKPVDLDQLLAEINALIQ